MPLALLGGLPLPLLMVLPLLPLLVEPKGDSLHQRHQEQPLLLQPLLLQPLLLQPLLLQPPLVVSVDAGVLFATLESCHFGPSSPGLKL
jgi:hypothetical protein